MKMRYLLTVTVLVLVAFGIAACSGDGGGGGNNQALQQQISTGETVYNDDCASCHANGVVGPDLTATTLANFANADKLHEYVSTKMPQTNPGSLTGDQYWAVEAFLLNRADLLGDLDSPLGADNAASVTITQ